MGRRLRELRLERSLQQGEIARRLGVSAAYVSLIEKGKRPVQLPLLVKALEIYDVSMDDFMRSLGEARVEEGLARLLDEPLLRSLNLSQDDLASLGAEPKVATTITALFNLYKNTRSQLDQLRTAYAQREREQDGDERLGFDYSPFDEVVDFLGSHRNFFAPLEALAERFRQDAKLGHEVTTSALAAAFESMFGLGVEWVRAAGSSSVIRRFDDERGVLTLSGEIGTHRRRFQLAHAVALRLLDDHPDLAADLLGGLDARHAETHRLVKIQLANYLAGAILLPYGPFLEVAQRLRYDVDRIAQYYGVGYETVSHRLCNLTDPKRPGVPFHFLRSDVAGNISRRYAANGLRVPQGTGSCPKWAVHTAFLQPQTINRQYSEFTDGTRYFCFAKVLGEPQQGSLARGTVYSIGLGMPADAASHVVYGDDMPYVDPSRMNVPVGISCRFCERTDCNQRAAPSYKFAFRVDEYTKKDNFFSPLVSDDRSPSTIPPESLTRKRKVVGDDD